MTLHIRDFLLDDLDPTICYYAIKNTDDGMPSQKEYQEAECSYGNETLQVRIPIDASCNKEGIYRIYVALKDKTGNVSYVTPASAVWYNMGNTVYDAGLTIDAVQKTNGSEAPTNQWYLVWDTGTVGEDTADHIITSAEVYESRDGGAFTKVAVCTTGQQEMKLPEMENYAIYRVIATYQDGSRRLSNVVSLKKDLKEEFVTDTEKEMELDLTSEEAEELIDVCAVAVEEIPVALDKQNPTEKSDRSIEIETNEYIYTSADTDTDGDGLLDGYEIWDFGTNVKASDSDGDGFADYYETTILGTDPAFYTKDSDRDNDGLTDQAEMTKGTDPYRKDTDFDGIADRSDVAPLLTDTASKAAIVYDVPVHTGLYDRTEKDGESQSIYNPYSGLTKAEMKEDSSWVRYYYDTEGNQTATVTREGTSYVLDTAAYDTNGNMTALTHNGMGYTFQYAGQDLTAVSVEGRKLVSYGYQNGADESRLQSSVAYANGGKETYAYTDMSITTTVENADGTKEPETSTQSMLTGVKVDGKDAFAYSYDKEGNITELEDKLNGVTYTYTYQNGELQSVKGSNGFLLTNTLQDDSNEAQKLSKYTRTATYQYGGSGHKMSYQYLNSNTDQLNASGITTLICGGTVSENVTADGDNHEFVIKNKSGKKILGRTIKSGEKASSVSYLTGDELSYIYDDNGNITSIRKNGAVQQTYTYDAFGQLKTETDAENGRKSSYVYDLNGNIKSQTITVNGKTTTHNYTYGDSDWRDLLTAYDGQAITYDQNGNPLTYRNGIKLTWKDGRQLASYEDDTYKITYDYNVSGIRVKKTVTEKHTGTKTVTENYLDGAHVVAQKITTQPSGAAKTEELVWYAYDGAGNLTGFQTKTGTYYYEKNLQGDIVGIVDENGASVVTYSYDAWGNVISVTDTSKGQISKRNPFGYRGYYQDAETGWYYLQSRYYDSETGRFLNADDVKNLTMEKKISSSNLVTYCENSAVNYSDSKGEKARKGFSTTVIGTILDIALTFACAYGAVTYDIIGAGFRIASKFVKKTLLKKLLKSKIVGKCIKLFVKVYKIVKKFIGKRLGIIMSNISVSIINGWLSKLIGRWKSKTQYITCLFSLGGLIALIFDVGDGKLDGKIYFRKK